MNKAEKVNELLAACLHGKLDGALEVECIVAHFLFDREKVAAHKEEIRALLDEMAPEFHAKGGGGMSFLNLCYDKNGEHWAEHPTMEKLVALGIAAGLAEFCLPRGFWSALPGGVPYIVFKTDKS